MEKTIRIFDFNVFQESSYKVEDDSESSSNEELQSKNKFVDSNQFLIQMFGLDELGKTCSILIEDFKPFFYVLVDDGWNLSKKNAFLQHLQEKMGKYYENSITECIIVKRKKLYGFDGGKEYKFVKLEFLNINAFNKAKNLWYEEYNNKEKSRKLLKNGYLFDRTYTKIYESNIPPLLRFFHIKDISPSGWIALPFKKTNQVLKENKKTFCEFEFIVPQKYILSLNNMETRVPFKICSFDIEASSSHGDFPVPIKSYKKLATNIIEFLDKYPNILTLDNCKNCLKEIILTAFGFSSTANIDIVYPKTKKLSQDNILNLIKHWFSYEIKNAHLNKEIQELNTIEKLFEKMGHEKEEEEEFPNFINNSFLKKSSFSKNTKSTIIDIICDKSLDRETKLEQINLSLNAVFPRLEGDKVTFIGSTFTKYGEAEPYFNHCISLNTCKELTSENTIIESYQSEKEVLLAWRDLIIKEDPDIIIGYNIFGFDYEFMFRRAEENNCIEEFLQLSRNKNEICAIKNKETGKYQLEETSIQIASGQHDLKYIKMNGRLQIDLYNFFRREENLSSYKLDYVAGHFIGDFIKTIEYSSDKYFSTIYSSNLTGLHPESFIHIEEIGHSIDYYDDGAKFKVTDVNKKDGYFTIKSIISPDLKSKKVRWCLAKDDVTPKDIFRMTNGTDEDRSIIAKYCIQDCNLVHYLFNKADILTGFIEMSKICSVPISFLVLRGQGIKLTSYIAKKCREKRTLMPVIDKGDLEEGYEGAIVLDPKCDLYLDNPVACVDYASLYPSSMISENLSHDSKVWTKEYDLAGNLIEEFGEKDKNGLYKYENLPGYEYVTITYDTYTYIRKTPSSSAEKVKCGQKTCCYAQFPEGKAIMPSILEELLKARKDTRKLIPLEKDEFMKNVLDKRQLGYKVTANSLYGQCGAKTSTFYEKDIAACTTATGRMLLTYAKRVIEECYGDSVCETQNHGPVLTKAEYIYGDSVANYTPIYISYFEKEKRIIDLITIENLAEKYGKNNWVTCLEPGKQEKEFCELGLDFGIETWTENGWTKLFRVIRHKLVSHKKMVRILTHSGLVDVTDDHSLLTKEGIEISPKQLNIGSELLHFPNPINNLLECRFSEDEARIMGFFFGDGSCGEYECPSGKKKTWALNNSSIELINKYLILCKKVYPSFDWVIMPTLESSGVYKISPRCNKYGFISNFVKDYRKILYYEKCKIIPIEILNSSINIKLAFFEGLYDADGDKDNNGYTRIDQKNQISASHICLLAQSLGYLTSINTRSDKENIFRVTMTKNKQRKNINAIKKILEIKYEGYVYDLTTENHHFAAGIGNLIVHNTDSVFFTFNLQTKDGIPIRGKDALEITIELAQEAGHLASSFLKKPHDLEYEKTFMPFCLLSKKRYVGILYEKDPNKGKRKEMGICLKRRDNAPVVKDIYGGVIDILMKEQDIQKAVDFLKNCLQNMVDEKYPMDKLIITKSLRSGYKNPLTIAHKVLADRITARDPGNKLGPGDRIPFIYINNSNKKALQGEKIETPNYIKEKNLKIDYSFYITNQIMKPVQQLFALVLEKIWKMQKKESKIVNFKKEIESVKKSFLIEEKEKMENKIEQIRNKEVKVLLFDKYLRETTNEKEGNQSLTKFFQKNK